MLTTMMSSKSSTTQSARSDTFTRADSNTTINPPSDGGSNYSIGSGTWGISSNQGYLVSGVGQDTAVLDNGAAISSVQATLATYADDTGLILRWADTNNYVVLVLNSGGSSTIYKNVAGSFISLGSSAALGWVSGDVAKFSVDGSNVFTVYRNGSLVLTSSADAAGATNTKHGLRSNAVTTARFTNLSITSP